MVESSRRDVLAAKERSPVSGKSAASPLPARVPSGQTEKIVLTKMRQTIATRLQQSKQNIPHFYETIDIDMTAAVELRKKLLEMYEKEGGDSYFDRRYHRQGGCVCLEGCTPAECHFR
ncbi:MAG: hypothetical protein KatS3mg104_0710 [Phycisphaerae bacterium]|nr:MAG: hypothetical protein KatS3mg104_0710 [Phycisphaerae bacterium]